MTQATAEIQVEKETFDSSKLINACKAKIKQKLNETQKIELKKSLEVHWNDEIESYAVPIENKILLETYLTQHEISFDYLEDIHDDYYNLSSNEKKIYRLDQAKRMNLKECFEFIGTLQVFVDDFNTRWQSKLVKKDLTNATSDTLKNLLTTEDPKQLEHINSLYAVAKKINEQCKKDSEFDKKIKNSKMDEENKKSNIMRFGNYIVKESGLYYAPHEKKENESDTWISSPIWPEVYLRDKEGENHSLLIKVNDGEKDHRVVLPRSIISKFSELCEILLNLGQCVPTSPALQSHFKNFIMSAKPKELMRCVHKAGWHGEQYVFPDGEVIGKALNTESVYPLNRDIPRGLKQKGTHEDWLKNVWELCANNSRLIFSIGVSLAAPCMYLTDEDSGGFNYVGDSSIGKSRCLETAISIYGSPDFKRSWKNTSNGFEAICSLHHDLLLPMDEGGQADPKELGENIYMFSQGQGKGRMYKDTNARDSKYWRAMLLSTAENGLNVLMQEANKKTKPGQLVRIADIPAAVEGKFGCFEDLHGFENGVDGEFFAEKIKEVTRKYYGTTGRAFIKAIINHGIDNVKEDLNNLADDFAADVARNYDGQVKRVANRFGLVYAALSLAIKLKVLNGTIVDEEVMNAVKSCFLGWLGKRGTTSNMEAVNIVEQVESLLIENSDGKFIDISEYTNDKKLRLTLWGCRDGSKFYVFCGAFKNHLCKGYDSDQVIEKLLDAKILHHKVSEYQKKINGLNARYYFIDLEKHKP